MVKKFMDLGKILEVSGLFVNEYSDVSYSIVCLILYESRFSFIQKRYVKNFFYILLKMSKYILIYF